MASKGLRQLSAFTVVLGIIFFILQYFSYVIASTEQRVIDLEIGSIKRLFKASQYVSLVSSFSTDTWEKKQLNSLMHQVIPMQTLPVISELYSLEKGQWGFYLPSNQLVYRIKETAFFKSANGEPFIFISTIIRDNQRTLKVSPFKWCQLKGLWGCVQWD